MLSRIRDKVKQFANRSLVSEEDVQALVKDIQRDLIQADVSVEIVSQLTKRMKQRALQEEKKEGMNLKEHVLRVVYDELVSILGEKPTISLEPRTIVLAGLYGSGKTATAGKLANYYRKRGMKVGLIPADTYRPAATEQLHSVAEKAQVDYYKPKSDNAVERVRNGISQLHKEECDIVIIDSAGRDALNDELITEITDITTAAQPEDILLVVPADIGQSAGELASTFDEAMNITGVVVTKTDMSAKGGGAVTACFHTNAQVYFLGTGEQLTDIRMYDPMDYIETMLGIPNLQGLLEKAEETIDAEDAQKMMEGEFDLIDFYEQIHKASSSGMFSQIANMFNMQLPQNLEEQMGVSNEEIEAFHYILESMTQEEKHNPDVINKSRIERIARGSGRSEDEVRKLVKSYRQAKNMMQKFSKKSFRRGPLKDLMQQFGG